MSWTQVLHFFSFSRLLRLGRFGLRNGCEEPMPLTWESRETSHQTLTEAFVYAEDASQRKSRGLLGGLFHWTFRHLSIAVIPDSNAHAGSTEADTATVLIPLVPPGTKPLIRSHWSSRSAS
jgi:hypothetical protein